MNLGEIIDFVIAKAIAPSRTAAMPDVNRSYVRQVVNEAYHRIERAAMWKFSEEKTTLTATKDTAALTPLPADLGLILSLHNLDTERELYYVDERQMTPSRTEKGRVAAYSYWGGVINLWPIPQYADDIELRYYKTWSDLVDDSDEPIIPDAWHQILVDYATAQTVLRIPPTGDRFLPSSAAEPFMNSWREGLQAMLSSPLTLTVGDKVHPHDYEDLIEEGHW